MKMPAIIARLFGNHKSRFKVDDIIHYTKKDKTRGMDQVSAVRRTASLDNPKETIIKYYLYYKGAYILEKDCYKTSEEWTQKQQR